MVVESTAWLNEIEVAAEEASDAILKEVESRLRVYSERQLARKIRLEQKRLPELDETTAPDVVVDYLLRKQMELMVDSAKLSKLQASIFALLVDGWTMKDISRRFDLPYHVVVRQARIIRMRVQHGGSPWDGLYEVYWREVHRTIYRRRTTG